MGDSNRHGFRVGQEVVFLTTMRGLVKEGEKLCISKINPNGTLCFDLGIRGTINGLSPTLVIPADDLS